MSQSEELSEKEKAIPILFSIVSQGKSYSPNFGFVGQDADICLSFGYAGDNQKAWSMG
ncbi:MAG: hypothetical protein AB4042_18575 [Leptolyngbyaceae cyanobacterium]